MILCDLIIRFWRSMERTFLGERVGQLDIYMYSLNQFSYFRDRNWFHHGRPQIRLFFIGPMNYLNSSGPSVINYMTFTTFLLLLFLLLEILKSTWTWIRLKSFIWQFVGDKNGHRPDSEAKTQFNDHFPYPMKWSIVYKVPFHNDIRILFESITK